MKKLNRNVVLSLFALTVLSVTSNDSVAQDTSKPITLVVPFGSGGSTDITARLLADKLRIELGQTIVVENKGGAAGNIGAAQVARATPDGLTLLFITSTHVSNPSLYKNLSYDVMKDLTPISRVAFLPNMLVVNKDFPANTLQEFVSYVKEKKGPMNYGSSGTGTSQHLAGALFNNMAGGGMVHVPYKGGGAAVTDLMGGQIQLYFGPAVEMVSIIESGRVKVLGVTTKERTQRFPNVQPINELFPGYELLLWNGIMTTAGSPTGQIERVNAALQKVLTDPEVTKKIYEQGSIPAPNSVSDFKLYMESELKKWAALIKLSGVTAQ